MPHGAPRSPTPVLEVVRASIPTLLLCVFHPGAAAVVLIGEHVRILLGLLIRFVPVNGVEAFGLDELIVFGGCDACEYLLRNGMRVRLGWSYDKTASELTFMRG